MPEIVDDKSQHCIPFLLERLRIHTERHANADGNTPPFFLGLNGVQGAGKTVLVSLLRSRLWSYLGTIRSHCSSVNKLI